MEAQFNSMNFYGAPIGIMKCPDETYVIAKDVSLGLGMQWSYQRSRMIDKTEELGLKVLRVHMPSNNSYSTDVYLPLDSISVYLDGIGPRRVRGNSAEMLALYKSELTAATYGLASMEFKEGPAPEPVLGRKSLVRHRYMFFKEDAIPLYIDTRGGTYVTIEDLMGYMGVDRVKRHRNLAVDVGGVDAVTTLGDRVALPTHAVGDFFGKLLLRGVPKKYEGGMVDYIENFTQDLHHP